MKKVFFSTLLALSLATTAILFASCKPEEEKPQPSDTVEIDFENPRYMAADDDNIYISYAIVGTRGHGNMLLAVEVAEVTSYKQTVNLAVFAFHEAGITIATLVVIGSTKTFGNSNRITPSLTAICRTANNN
ncbi:MAG: hypothetical protein II661_04985, partial [Bacteroidales bacterium]|nr:hypothetical protein [Bacteroidales bacterium]